MLESFIQGKINIHDLSVEAPEREEEPWFDPKKEITREEREKMERAANDDFTENQFLHLEATSAMKYIFPNWKPPPVTEEKFQEVLQNVHSFWLGLYSLFTLFPERRAAIQKEAESVSVVNALDSSKVYFLILFPERRSELSLTEINWRDTKRDYERMLTNKDWWSITWIIGNARILFPERFKELSLTPRFINEMKKFWRNEYLNKEYIANKGYSNALDFAHHLQIITAEEIKFTDHGLELVMSKPKPKLDKIPPQPEIRKF